MSSEIKPIFRIASVTLLTALLQSSAPSSGQEIPRGVNYKRASDELNGMAKTKLEKALQSDAAPTDLYGGVTVVGPMLWKALKPSAEKVMLEMMPVVLMVPGPPSFSAEGKRVLTDAQREAFWKSFHRRFSRLKDARIRKGNAEEISYYWATIPFDITEPFWVIESGADRFVAHFQVKDGKPGLFWIDLVGDLNTLKP